MNAHKQKQRKRNGIFRKWHRRLGLLASLFLFNLAITGILLNHYEAFNLHKSYVSSDWLLDHYGIVAPSSVACYSTGNNQYCQAGNLFYRNQEFLFETNGQLSGALAFSQGDILLGSDNLLLITENGEIIDQVYFNSEFNHQIKNAQVYESGLIVSSGDKHYQLDSYTLEWSMVETLPQKGYQNASNLDGEGLSNIQSDFRSRQLTELRLLQDIHSGAIFQLSGKLVNDITALLLLVIAISGFITWQRRKNSQA